LGADFSVPVAQPRPAVTVLWRGAALENWSAVTAWQDASTGISRLPDFSPATADVVNVTSAGGPVIAGGTANARVRDLFIGRLNSNVDGDPAQVHIQSGGRLRTDSIFVGTEPGEHGELLLNGGSIDAASEYVGFRGRGVLWHTGGTNRTVALSIGKDNQAADGTALYLMLGTPGPAEHPHLHAGRIVIGEQPGSAGQLVMVSGLQATIESAATVVGDRGIGTVNQLVGTHTIETDLIMGNHLAAHGGYVLDRDAMLNTGRTLVGISGTGSFQQHGGVHETGSLEISDASTYALLGGMLKTNSIQGRVQFASSAAKLHVDGLGDYAKATFIDAHNATLELAPDSLALLAQSVPFASVINHGTLPVHVVGTPLAITAGGFRGFGDITDPVSVSGSGHITAASGSQPLRLPELRLSGMAQVFVEADAVLEISAIEGTALIIEAGSPSLNINQGTLTIAQAMPAVGLRVATGARLAMQTTETLDDEAFQMFCMQADVLVEPGATLSARGGVNFAVGRRSLNVDGTLDVGPGIDRLDIRSLGLSSNEDVVLHFTDSATLAIDWNNDRHDHIAIERGTAELAGNLSLTRAEGFLPQLGDEIDILAAQNGVSGVFDSIAGTIVELGFNTTRDDLGLAVRYTEDEDSDIVRVRASLLGDVDFDNSVDLEDQGQVLAHFGAANATWEMGDFNGDGAVNEADLAIVSSNLGLIHNPNAAFGDYDQNGDVNAADYAVWRNSIGQIGIALAADGNRNGRIDTNDYQIWRARFGQGVPQSVTLFAVPEPSTALIMAISCLAQLLRWETSSQRRYGSQKQLELVSVSGTGGDRLTAIVC
jgi:hypothetical protein